jgi:hypothetical protein
MVNIEAASCRHEGRSPSNERGGREMTKKVLGAAGLALLLAACAGEEQDAGTAMVLVRSSAVFATDGTGTIRVFHGLNEAWDSAHPLFARDLGVQEDGEWEVSFDSLAPGDYTFCAQATAGALDFGPGCTNAKITKNRMAVVSLVLQQVGNPDVDETIDSPLISGISLSDGAPGFGQPVDMAVTVQDSTTLPSALTYAWTATCDANPEASIAFVPDNAASTTLSTNCEGLARITITVSDGAIASSVTFPLRYYPQGADVSVSLNRWPVFTGFAVAQAQLQPGSSTVLSVAMTDDEALSFAWTASCGSLAAATTAVGTNTFTAPAIVGDCTVTVAASDGIGGSATASVILHVADAVAPTLLVFSNLPAVLPPNLPSQGFQATQTAELGDHVALAAGVGRRGDEATVLMSTWSMESYSHPITLTLYAVVDGQPGPVFKTVTQEFVMPARPAADATCSTPTAWRAADGRCYNGYLFPITFELGGVALPDSFIYGISYNTQTWGYAPIGVGGPYTSLNVALVADGPNVGIDVDSDAVYWNTMTPGNYSLPGPVGTFRMDTHWTGYVPAVEFSAY